MTVIMCPVKLRKTITIHHPHGPSDCVHDRIIITNLCLICIISLEFEWMGFEAILCCVRYVVGDAKFTNGSVLNLLQR